MNVSNPSSLTLFIPEIPSRPKIKTIPDDLQICEPISTSHNSVYLAESVSQNSKFAVKFFPYLDENEVSHQYTAYQTALEKLDHPNIIAYAGKEDLKKVKKGGKQQKSSFLVMEFAKMGNFSDFAFKVGSELSINSQISRTYMHQLIDALEHIHQNQIVHLDICPENLLLDKKFQLKVADFKQCQKIQVSYSDISSEGTPGFRAPELKEKKSIKDITACDVYSAGIMLFVLRMGLMPYVEDEEIEGFNLQQLLHEKSEDFWKVHQKFLRPEVVIEDEFKELFEWMTHPEPSKRPSLDQIRQHRWFSDIILTQKQLKKTMKSFLIPRNEKKGRSSV